MKVVIIERQDFKGTQLKQSIERVCYPDNMDELSNIPRGVRAKRIRLECEFDEKDIPKLLTFLQNSQQCFGA